MKTIFTAIALTALTLPGAIAQERHPHYLHALSDLRYARFLINQPAEFNVWVDQKEAVGRIDRAIGEIKRASIDDHKDLYDHPAPDPTWDRAGRLHKAIELLESCERDLKYEEDDYRALGWRANAQMHVHEALERTRKALNDKRRDQRY
jgi:hypothetical protein